MELKLENGVYQPASSGLLTVSGAEELAQRITMKLTARRGKFWPMPDYGSRLYTLLSGVKPENRELAVREFTAEALADEPWVSLENLNMRVEGDALILNMDFKYSGGIISLETAVVEEI